MLKWGLIFLAVWCIRCDAVSSSTSTPLSREMGQGSEMQLRASDSVPGYELMAQISIFFPEEFLLIDNTFETPLSGAGLDGMPTFQVGVEIPLYLGDIKILGGAMLGYSYKEGSFLIYEQRDGNRTVFREAEPIRLHRVPMTFLFKFLFPAGNLTFMKPVFMVGGGLQWIYQKLGYQEIDRDYMIPYYLVSPGITFFSDPKPADWFGGFTFGISYQSSLGSGQVIKGWSFDLAGHFIL